MNKELNIEGIVIKAEPNIPDNMGIFIPKNPSYPPAIPGEDPMVKFVQVNGVVIFTTNTSE